MSIVFRELGELSHITRALVEHLQQAATAAG
jgi:hypothetical protein